MFYAYMCLCAYVSLYVNMPCMIVFVKYIYLFQYFCTLFYACARIYCWTGILPSFFHMIPSYKSQANLTFQTVLFAEKQLPSILTHQSSMSSKIQNNQSSLFVTSLNITSYYWLKKEAPVHGNHSNIHFEHQYVTQLLCLCFLNTTMKEGKSYSSLVVETKQRSTFLYTISFFSSCSDKASWQNNLKGKRLLWLRIPGQSSLQQRSHTSLLYALTN